MKKYAWLLCLIFSSISLNGRAFSEMVSPQEAREVSRNWALYLVNLQGHWSGSPHPEVLDVQELREEGKKVGYLCRMSPRGFIIISLLKQLAPIKAYSSFSDLDPEIEKGMMKLIKNRLAMVLSGIERKKGALPATLNQTLEDLSIPDYRPVWSALLQGAVFEEGLETGRVGANYQTGKVLLSTEWNQNWPYNAQCPVPNPPCANPSLNGHYWSGCTAVAGAQIMRYWAWPPYGVGSPYGDDYYDWVNMVDRIDNASPPQQIAAVANLHREVGLAADMTYGCEGSSASIACLGCRALEDAFSEDFRYIENESQDRDDYNADQWFDLIKGQLNLNRPMPYHIPDHAIVVDGWQEFYIVGTWLKQYHVNYGWGGSHTVWFNVDEIYGGNPDEEYLLVNVVPDHGVGSPIAGTYPRDPGFPYRYFEYDTLGNGTAFSAGQLLQFLTGKMIRATGPSGIVFYSTSDLHSVLYSDGNPSRGIKLKGSSLKLYQDGGLSVLPLGPPRRLTVSYNEEFDTNYLAWEAGYGGQDGFVVEKKVTGQPNWTVLGSTGGQQTSYMDVNPASPATHEYRVRASLRGNFSEYSPIVAITVW